MGGILSTVVILVGGPLCVLLFYAKLDAKKGDGVLRPKLTARRMLGDSLIGGILIDSVDPIERRKGRAMLERLAMSGDPDAAGRLGEYYAYSQYSKADLLLSESEKLKAAIKYFEIAYQGKNYKFLECIWQSYLDLEDNENTIKYLNIAIQHNMTNSMRFMGELYKHGSRVPKNEKRAFELFQKAAELGSPYTPELVAECYRDGIGVEKDPIKAYAWYNVFAAHEDVENREQYVRNREINAMLQKEGRNELPLKTKAKALRDDFGKTLTQDQLTRGADLASIYFETSKEL